MGAFLGGAGFYGLARYRGSQRKVLYTIFGSIVPPFIGWGCVVNQDKERVIAVTQRLQAADPRFRGPGEPAGPAGLSRPPDHEALSKLFPPPPSAIPPPV